MLVGELLVDDLIDLAAVEEFILECLAGFSFDHDEVCLLDVVQQLNAVLIQNSSLYLPALGLLIPFPESGVVDLPAQPVGPHLAVLLLVREQRFYCDLDVLFYRVCLELLAVVLLLQAQLLLALFLLDVGDEAARLVLSRLLHGEIHC